jgi:aspartyl-tRNA(Asn)/glutamyl-tRNA(Gln) amidotransferase subunit C
VTTISLDNVKKLASLSALKVSDEEAVKLQSELQNILKFVEQLDAVDTTGVEPTYQVTGLTNVWRDDEIIDYGLSREQLLKNAPDEQDGQIKVKRVLA